MAGLEDIEELASCSCCHRAFDDAERTPKLLACKHTFCLHCAATALSAGGDHARCEHCAKRTELPLGAAALPTHRAALALARRLRPPPADDDARPQLRLELRQLRGELAQLAARQRAFLLRALDAATALKLRLEAALSAPPPEPATTTSLDAEVARLRARRETALRQCRLDDLVRDAHAPLNVELLQRALGDADADAEARVLAAPEERYDPVLFLGNYCTAALYARAGGERAPAPCALPLVFLGVQLDGRALGRVVLQLRADVAPRMARNFALLAERAAGAGYRGCAVFQCWRDESVIAGDWELNDGRGGRSALAEAHFLPDDSRLAAVRGAVGMRRERRRRDRLGLVGSQFRIVLREMRGFTAIFGAVVEGLELVECLSRTGDGAGKPRADIVIATCGRLN